MKNGIWNKRVWKMKEGRMENGEADEEWKKGNRMRVIRRTNTRMKNRMKERQEMEEKRFRRKRMRWRMGGRTGKKTVLKTLHYHRPLHQLQHQPHLALIFSSIHPSFLTHTSTCKLSCLASDDCFQPRRRKRSRRNWKRSEDGVAE